MIDIKLLRENREEIQEKLKSKDASLDVHFVLKLDEELRNLKQDAEHVKSKRNASSKLIGEMKRKGEDTSKIMQDVATLGDEIQALDHKITEIDSKFQLEFAKIPNIPMDDVRVSKNVDDNVCIKNVGKKPSFSFQFKNHLELNESLQLFDFERGAKISGSGWPIYHNIGAQLEWALINLMIDQHLKKGFKFWMLPLLVHKEMMFGSAQLPKFEGQFYALDDTNPLYLLPTGEVALNGLHFDEILEEEDLPLKYITYTPCFRREAGAAGKQERGLIRTHQFNKVEMFAFCKPALSEKVFEDFVESAESILTLLDLHYRVMTLVTGDMSFAAAKTVDLEVWLPGQERYYEVSSVSNCTDYQARRSKTRYRPIEGGKPHLVHTLNGSGLATSRLMVALLENNQQEDGSVVIPKSLQPYLRGMEILNP